MAERIPIEKQEEIREEVERVLAEKLNNRAPAILTFYNEKTGKLTRVFANEDGTSRKETCKREV